MNESQNTGILQENDTGVLGETEKDPIESMEMFNKESIGVPDETEGEEIQDESQTQTEKETQDEPKSAPIKQTQRAFQEADSTLQHEIYDIRKATR
eukprot:14455114-Ditylum_brightwellii.AAC.1